MKINYANYYRRFQQLSRQPQAKVSGLISLTIFTVAFFGIFAILPTFKTVAQLSREIEDTETTNAKLTKKIQNLSKAEESYTQTLDELAVVSEVLPESAEFERLAWQLYWLAYDKNLELSSGNFGEFTITEEKTSQGEKLLALPVELTVNGSYGQIKEFLRDLARIDRLMATEEVSINKKKFKNEVGKITASLKLTAYYLP
jgi:type IV pilus assembly protein PilO